MATRKVNVYLPEGDPIYSRLLDQLEAVVTDRQALLRQWLLAGFNATVRSPSKGESESPAVAVGTATGGTATEPPELPQSAPPPVATAVHRLHEVEAGHSERSAEALTEPAEPPAAQTGTPAAPRADAVDVASSVAQPVSATSGSPVAAPSVRGLL